MPEKSNIMIEKIQNERLMACNPEVFSCVKPSSSVDTESTTCIADRTTDKLSNTNTKRAIARSMYELVDQCDIS
jgi:ABC-type sulfate transport system substrate-binding protein